MPGGRDRELDIVDQPSGANACGDYEHCRTCMILANRREARRVGEPQVVNTQRRVSGCGVGEYGPCCADGLGHAFRRLVPRRVERA